MHRIAFANTAVRFCTGLFAIGIAMEASQARAQTPIVWQGTTSDFEAGSNWDGGVAPENNLFDNTAVFSAKGLLPNPALTMDRAIYGVDFQHTGWTLGGPAYTLTVGTGGIKSTHTTTSSTTIQAKAALGASSTWMLGSDSSTQTLTLAGGLTSQAGHTFTLAANPGAFRWYYTTLSVTGPASLAGDVVLEGPNLRIANYTASSIAGNLQFRGGTLAIDGDFTRDLGAGPGQVRFVSGSPNGFTNHGSSRITVTLGDGAGGVAALKWGDGWFNPGILKLAGNGAGAGGITFVNPIDLNGATRTFYNYAGSNVVAELSGLISNSGAGAAGITKHNYSFGMTYLANNANTFDGPITINRGSLRFDTIGNIGSGPTALGNPTTAGNALITVANSSATQDFAASLIYSGSDVLTTNRPIRIGGPATIRSTGTGAITFTADMAAPVGHDKAMTLTLGGTSTGANTFAGRIPDRSANSPISVVKADAGTWILSGDNTYTGNTTVRAGTLQLGASEVLSQADLTVSGGATLDMQGFNQSVNALYLQDGTIDGSGTLNLSATSYLTKGVIDANLGGNLGTGGGDRIEIGGDANATVELNGHNTFTAGHWGILIGHAPSAGGPAGTVKLGHPHALGNTGRTSLYTGELDLNGLADVAANYIMLRSNAASLVNNNTGSTASTAAQVLVRGTSGNPATDSRIGGPGNLVLSGQLTDGGNNNGFQKIGTGTLTLTGDNTYTGPTTVSAGRLLVHGTHNGGGDYTVHSGATLGGNGSIGANIGIQSGGRLAPGASIGRLTIGGDLTLAGGAEWDWEFLNNDSPDNYDQVAGPTLILPSDGASTMTLNILGMPGHSVNWYDEFVLFTGSVENFDAGMFELANNSDWTRGWAVSLGNSLILTAVPEPGTWLMLAGALAFGLLARRRR